LVAVLTVVAVWQGGRLLQTRRARSLHAEGIRALDEDRRDEALQAFIAANHADPGFLPACVNVGKLVHESRALVFLKNCHADFPDSSQVSYNLGQALALRSETEQAEAVLREALKKNDDPALGPMLLNELALVTIDLGRPDAAFTMLDSAMLPPSDTFEGAVLQKTLGLALLESDRPADAAESFRQALAGPLPEGTRANVLVGLGRALERQGDAGAARAYAEALLGRPDAEAEAAAREGLRRLQESAGASSP
jgi:tetratricopeptide (TPR) repeat protein